MHSVHVPEWFHAAASRHQQLLSSRVERDEVSDVVDPVLVGDPDPLVHTVMCPHLICAELW